MKTLYLTRHAKSSWKYEDLTDFERPLNKRGRRDAPRMGEILRAKGVRPDLIVSSPANRAITAARMLARALSLPSESLTTDERIYEAMPDDLMTVIRATDNAISQLMLVGHNPGLTMLSNYLADEYIDNIPTTGVATIEFRLDTWRDVAQNSGRLVAFDYPKKFDM